jgi:hypothetical protein
MPDLTNGLRSLHDKAHSFHISITVLLPHRPIFLAGASVYFNPSTPFSVFEFFAGASFQNLVRYRRCINILKETPCLSCGIATLVNSQMQHEFLTGRRTIAVPVNL